MKSPPIAALCISLALIACGGETSRSPEPDLWGPRAVALPGAAFFDERPWMKDVSTWSSTGCGRGQPEQARHMGDFGVGNGHVFALSGYACPINTLHTMIGPSYEKESGFFKDTWLVVEAEAEAEELKVREGRMFRIRRTDILVSYERSTLMEVFTVTFAPIGGGREDPVNRSIVRIVVVRNLSDRTVSGVRLRTFDGHATRDNRQRTLICLRPESDPEEPVFLGDLAPREEKIASMAYVITLEGAGEAETIAALRATDFDALLTETRDAWNRLFDRAAKLESPDPRVNDYYSGMLVTVRSQRTCLGGIGVMSEYTGMWLRNMSGPARFLSRIGLHGDVRDMLLYYHLAAIVEGDVRNSVALDHDPDAAPQEPDWASMPPFQGREEAESPSYLPLMVHWYIQASGDASTLEELYPMLRRCLNGQVVSEAGLLPFSGDETFRTAMSISSGLALDHDYKACCPSANSSFLYAAAAEALAGWADELGDAEGAEQLRERAARIRLAAEETYFTPEGYYLPYVDETDPGKTPAIFEDVSTKPIWTGYLLPTEERALSNLGHVVERIGRSDGFLVSPLHPIYDNALDLDIHEGVYTGMNPGYSLYNLAAVDHPRAQDAFNALALAASPSGNSAEYQIYDDHSALQIVYDASGTLGDYTARYMNWEGSVLADALVYYLAGFKPDAQAGAVRLAPRLPNNWPWMKWSDLRVGAVRFDLLVEELGSKRRVTVTPGEEGILQIHLSVPLPEVVLKRVVVNGVSVGPSGYEVWSPFGQTRVRLPATEATATSPLIVTVEYDPP